jgi:IS5 family transposase
LADAVVEGSRPVRDRLSEIDGLMNWSRFGALLPETPTSTRGEAAYPALVLFKALLLQRWYQLSDPGLEEALADRLSFRRFCGLALADETPDHSTLWRFRDRLTRLGVLPALMVELASQLDGHGVVLRQGTLIDASIIRSAARRPRMEEAPVSPVDPDARFGTNNERRRFEFGYKLHVAVDAGSQLVRGLVVTSANVQEVHQAARLIQGDEVAVYADRGYDSGRLHGHLASLGIADGIIRRRRGKQPLSAEETARNRRFIRKRRPVEALFGTLKRSYGFTRMRCFSLARNTTDLTLACFAYNLRRLSVLVAS